MLKPFLHEWLANPQWWFSPSHKYDSEITEKFKHLLSLDFYIHDLDQVEVSALCILYDQIPRHAYRDDDREDIISYFLELSMACFREIRDIHQFSGHHLCFLLLPLRHTRIQENIDYTTSIIWGKLSKNNIHGHELDIYKRFLKATYKNVCENQNIEYFEPKYIDKDTFRSFLISNASILDHIDILDQSDKETYEYKKTDEVAIISLSGGVDSTVLSYVSKKIYKENCVCLHINYANRETSDDEAEFVKQWCSYIGIPLFVRKIDEINRPLCMKFGLRETYETYTKLVRFKCYYQIVETYKPKQSFILLGHNKDDCFENILTNMNKRNIENLIGMNKIQKFEEELIVIRPFLEIPKEQLINIAHEHGIPYLYDSTPSWSQRGKIRDRVVPALKSWNDKSTESFIELAHHVNALNDIKNNYVDMILQNAKKTDESTTFHLDTKVVSEIIWRSIFSKLNILQPSKKSIAMFCDKLKNTSKPFRVNISKLYSVNVDQHTYTIRKLI